MEKINVALCGVEDNAERIKRLERELALLKTKSAVTVVDGAASGGVTSFGNVSGTLAIVTFDGNACGVYSNGDRVGGGNSPVVAEITQGALTLDAVRENAKAFIVF